MSIFPGFGGLPTRRRRLRSLALALGASLTVLLGGAAPAFASHLQGGYLTANVTADGHLQGTLTFLQLRPCSAGIGSQMAFSISVTAPGGQVANPQVTTYATRCDTNSSAFTGSFDIPLTTATFSQGAPDGAYTIQWASSARIAGIVNLANSDSYGVQFRARVRKIAGIATGAPFLGSNIATGIGIGDLYSQNLNASDPDDVLGNGTLTYQALTGNADVAPDTNIIDVAKLQANGQIEIPASVTSGMANNSYYIYKVRVTDGQGDYAERDVLLKAVTPNHPPVISGLDTSNGYDINAGDTQVIHFTATDPDGANTVTLSGAGLPSWATLTQTPGNPAQGTLTLAPPAGANTRNFRLNFDASDNDTSQALTGSATVQVRVNGTPETQLLTWPASLMTSRTASFTFAAANSSYTFECSFDGGTTWDPCVSGQQFSNLADGAHTFKVRANDAGVVDPTPATYSWTIDATAPTTTFATKPPAATSSTTASFTFSTNESGSVTYECSLDGASYTACTAPKSYSGLADGSHTLRVRGTDSAGNVESPAASYTWIVDRTAPDTALSSTPPLLANSASANFAFTATEPGSTFECKLDGGSWAACTSPVTFPSLADGAHTVQVRATDGAGNTDATPVSYAWVVDTTAPDTAIATHPAALTVSTSAAFTFSTPDGTATLECRVDGGAWATCTSPASLTALADGDHTFEVRAIDAAGNADATPATFTWQVDSAAPSTTVSGKPAAKVRTVDASIAFGSTDGSATFECQLDGGAWVSCTSPARLTGLADGPHTLKIRATDAAGNVEATPATVTWLVDTVAPSAPGLTQTPSDHASASAFVIDRDPDATLECQVDGGAWEPCSAQFEPTDLPDGTHTVAFRQTDATGNVSDISTHTWTLDRVAPDAPTVLSGPAAQGTDLGATFEFSAEPGATVECRLDGGAWGACASPLKLGNLGLGDHVLELRATDAAGNVSAVRAERWTITKTPDAAPAGPKAAKVEISRSLAVDPKKSTVGCSLSGVNISSCKVAVYAKRSDLGLAAPGSKDGDELVRIGTGYAETDGSTGRVGVKIVLNDKGKKAMARPGGVKVRVNIKARPSSGGSSLYAHRYSRLRPATQLVVPSDGLFATDSAAISRTGKRYLQSVAGGLYGAKGLTCIGHTDAQGPAAYNTRLGLARAKAVCAYLGRLGVKVPRSTKSAGETHPRATNMTAVGRALNRRVELTVRYQ